MNSRSLLFIIGLFVWLLLSWPPDIQHLLVGIIVAFLISWITGDMFVRPVRKDSLGSTKLSNGVKRPHIFTNFRRYLWFLYYIPVFLWECIKANIDVAYRVAHPDVPIRPGIVKIKTNLKSDTGLTFLANSITLTPGTMSVDIDREAGIIYIHCIYVKDHDIEAATKLISRKFEDILKRIFE